MRMREKQRDLVAMAMAVPPLLPTSVPSATPVPAPDVATVIASAKPAATRSFLSHFLDSTKRSLLGARPWPELLVALSLTVSLLAHPFSLAALLALVATCPADAPQLAACGRTFFDRETLGGFVAVSAFVVFLTSVGRIIFSTLALGAAVICAHGASRVPEDLFLYLLIMEFGLDEWLKISCCLRMCAFRSSTNGFCTEP